MTSLGNAGSQASAEAAAYFHAYHEQKAATHEARGIREAEANAEAPDAAAGADAAAYKVQLLPKEWATLEDRRARIYAASELASATVNAAAPLLVNDSLEVATSATDVVVVRA